MVEGDRLKVDPVLLPPSPRAALYHGLRAYDQIQIWKQFSDAEKDPLRWEWVTENKMYTPVMTNIKAGPPDLLKVIRCGFMGPCGKSCSCRKASLNCASTCKGSHGITCTNAPVIEPKVEEDEYERNFLDIFY